MNICRESVSSYYFVMTALERLIVYLNTLGCWDLKISRVGFMPIYCLTNFLDWHWDEMGKLCFREYNDLIGTVELSCGFSAV